MLKKAFTYLQYCVPKQLVSVLMGSLADSSIPWLKNFMIRRFIKKYHVDMSLARIEDPAAYKNFNDFFIRQLKPALRPIASSADDIASPVDGCVSQIGKIDNNQLLQVKNFYFNLQTLLANDPMAEEFNNGAFATLYLAPCDYHRVHMPLAGTLVKTVYVPGSLFSVNQITSQVIPNLYSRNERLISLFDTAAGPMAVILVGAMIVGSIRTVWAPGPIRSSRIHSVTPPQPLQLAKGDELGHFQLGSTVILLFKDKKVIWNPALPPSSSVKLGQLLGSFVKN